MKTSNSFSLKIALSFYLSVCYVLLTANNNGFMAIMDSIGGYKICQTSDSGFVLLGHRISYHPTLGQQGTIFLSVMNKHGDVLHTKSITDGNDFRAAAIEYVNDTSIFVAAGYNYVIKIDTGLNIRWQMRYDIATAGINRLSVSPQGDILLTGSTIDNKGLLIKAKADGGPQWAKTILPDSGGLYLTGSCFLEDGSVIVTGKGIGVYCARFDSVGNCQWSINFSNTHFQAFPVSLCQIGSNVFISGFQNSKPFVASVNITGQLRFMKNIESNDWTECFSFAAAKTNDEQLAINLNAVGHFNPYQWVGLAKLDTGGNVTLSNSFAVDKPLESWDFLARKEGGYAIICYAPDDSTYFNTAVITANDSFNHVCNDFPPQCFSYDIPVDTHSTGIVADTFINQEHLLLIESPVLSSSYIYCQNDTAQPFPVNIPLAIEEVELTVRPNPAKEKVYIELDTRLTGGLISIYDAAGKLLIHQSTYNEKCEVDVSQLQKGFYVLTITNENLCGRRKLIIE